MPFPGLFPHKSSVNLHSGFRTCHSFRRLAIMPQRPQNVPESHTLFNATVVQVHVSFLLFSLCQFVFVLQGKCWNVRSTTILHLLGSNFVSLKWQQTQSVRESPLKKQTKTEVLKDRVLRCSSPERQKPLRAEGRKKVRTAQRSLSGCKLPDL